MFVVIGSVITAAVVTLIALVKLLSDDQLDWLVDIAPLITAIIATAAAIIAFSAVYVQRDTAKRRAAIDFFLKTEMDEKIIEAYNEFQKMLPNVPTIVARQSLEKTDKDLLVLTRWLNICELIAVGINLDAFSDKVSYAYWGYVLPDSFKQTKAIIDKIRSTESLEGARKLGGQQSLCDLEKLCLVWSKRKAKKNWLQAKGAI